MNSFNFWSSTIKILKLHKLIVKTFLILEANLILIKI